MSTSVQSQGSASADVSNQQPDAGGQWNAWGMIKAFTFRLLITYFVFNLFRRQPANQPGAANKPVSSTNIFQSGTPMEMYVFMNEHPTFTAFNDSQALFWHKQDLVYGDWTGGPHGDGSYTKDGEVDCSQFPQLMHNGSLYLHVYVVKQGFSPDPSAGNRYSKRLTIYRSKMITRYKRRRLSRTVNLLTGQTDTHPDLIANLSTPADVTYLPATTHWHPNLTINLVDDQTPWVKGAVPAPLDYYIEFYEPTNEYYPVLYFNDYWNLNEDYKPVNETTPLLPMSLTVAPLSLFKWQLYAAQSSRKNWFTNLLGDANLGGEVESEEEQDTLKKALIETNPYLLALTVVVSIVHSIFELLAFKNDIQFWKTRESLEGLSVRSVFFNVFQSFIVLLYVLDNNTNFVITVSVFLGLGIEIWKIKKVLVFQVDWNRRVLGLLPYVRMNYQSSYVESDTKKYDQMAFRYLSWILFPMLAVYCGYSLVYQEHRGWYSWVLSMLYGFLLTFGFIMMTPQLFINYKLKSVAHLPWRMLTYKALNTFIDDLFAFVIRMPTLYRIGCLRDDVIFFIYLYQRWIYPMDPNRINEFGVSKEMLDKTEGIVTPESNGQLLLEDQASVETSRSVAAATAELETSGTRQRRRNVPTTQEN
ncbi:Cleft lip and palate transmembrane protein 1 like protein [Clonorchis sinensis]|uniref:Cleft lip and palate transmembrane protein 1 homolog n=2 Tax=Clonorchis sinensis TaxID=79923 RepID=G7YBB4_CLOSI|nr:Cleft lip and palate transmembrane protein 1 like protein [Clonorchis sinensis]GAA50248.1 cleft lip and palate transmembrane protein 1 homolog [Clonorchis sinensis]